MEGDRDFVDRVIGGVDDALASVKRLDRPASRRAARVMYTTAALTHARALLEGIQLCERAGLRGSVAAQLRAVWETHVVGLHLIVNGDAALEELRAAGKYAEAAFMRSNPDVEIVRGVRQRLVAYGDVQPTRLKFEQVAREVDATFARR